MDAEFRDPERILSEDGFVRGLARSLLFDRDRAEDVAQSAWLAACRDESPKRGMRPWLSGVVRRLAWRELRDAERRRARETRASRTALVPSTAEIHEREALRREVVELVLALEEPYRSALLLRFFENLTPRAIARRLNVPVETARTRIKRGLARLRRRLDRGELPRASIGVGLLGLAGISKQGIGIAGSAIGSFTHGVLAMKTGSKLGVAVALLLVVVGGWVAFRWFGSPGEPDRPAGTVTLPLSEGGWPESKGTPPAPAEAVTPKPIETRSFLPDNETALTPSTVGSLILTLVYARNGNPVPKTPVKILVWGHRDPFLNQRIVRTDDAGQIRIARLPVGSLTVQPLLGGMERVKIEADRETTARIEIPRGGRIEGRVTEADGTPVAAAEVWLNEWAGETDGFPLTRSALDGSFAIDDAEVTALSYLGARKPMREPTPLVSCAGGVDGVQKVTLVFPGPGGIVRGVVVDPERRPIAGARLRIGRAGGDQGRGMDGATGATPGPEVVVTDAEGRFGTSGLPVGKAPIIARADGFAAYRSEVEVQPERETTVEVVLGRGGTLAGKVVDAEGRPLERMAVEIGGYGTLESSLARTAADGSFVAAGIAPGVVAVKVEHREHGRWHGEAPIREGETSTLEIRLSDGLKILGRLVDESGAPLADLHVVAESFEGATPDYRDAKSDAEGRFVMKGCVDVPYVVSVRAKGGGVFDLARVEGVRPGEPERSIVVRGARDEPASLTGRVVDPEGRPLGNAEVGPSRVGTPVSPIEHVDGRTGAFVVKNLPAGRYRVNVRCPGYTPSALPLFELAPGETRDLGEIRLDRGGSLEVALDVEEGVDPGAVRVCFRPLAEGHPREGIVVAAGVARAEGVTPGAVEVDVSGQGIAMAEVTVEVVPGRTTKLRLPVRRGARRVVQLLDPPGQVPESATWVLRSITGEEVLSGRTLRSRDRLHRITLSVPPGVYVFAAVSSDGVRVTAPLEVVGFNDDPSPLVLGF